MIFPGSTLAKKQPNALMSAELVETSRLFARMNASIDPAWAEPIAGDLGIIIAGSGTVGTPAIKVSLPSSPYTSLFSA